jgi:hypothetical protein
MTLQLYNDRAEWEEIAQRHGLAIVASDDDSIHVALWSGVRTFALRRDTVDQYAFERAARRLRMGHTKLTV